MARTKAVSDDLKAIDQQIKGLIEERAKIELAQLIELRRQYLDVMGKIEKVVTPHGLTAQRYLSMRPEEAEEFIRNQARSVSAGVVEPATSRRKIKVPPKYRHPKDETMTWTGRGNQPRWVRQLVEEEGVDINSLLINPEDAKKKPAGKKAAKKAAKKATGAAK